VNAATCGRQISVTAGSRIIHASKPPTIYFLGGVFDGDALHASRGCNCSTSSHRPNLGYQAAPRHWLTREREPLSGWFGPARPSFGSVPRTTRRRAGEPQLGGRRRGHHSTCVIARWSGTDSPAPRSTMATLSVRLIIRSCALKIVCTVS
jgi:hypothetical protein